ncbi:MAG: zinc ABC transporter substrate-binding protein [Deltaproteobacteria bacterium]|nr:zinc ABC transporter substrate-binding protein [Deltaproteobacteria bacterium]
MKHPFRICLLVGCLWFTWATVSSTTPIFAEAGLNVIASIPPQKYFIQKIGGDRVKVSVMVLPGANPATYEPKPRQMVNLSKAKIYFAIGVPFEDNWLSKFSKTNAKMMVVATQSGIKKLPMKPGGHHHDETQNGHENPVSVTKDPHIWLSPPLVTVQARNILDGLVKADPEGQTEYKANYEAFLRELKDLDEKIREELQTTGPHHKFMVYHPSWGYFARTYGLEQIPIELEGKKPSPRKLLELVQDARKEGIKVIFVQPQFSKKSAETIAHAIGGKVVVADPLAEDWKNNLIQVAAKFRSAF